MTDDMARKDKRLFARFDLDYADHPKIGALSDAAFRAHVEMILYSRKYLTDGVISKRFAKRFATDSLSELLANDSESPSLIELDDGSYLIHGYEDMNDTREEVEGRIRANTENGRRGGLAKKRNAKQVANRVAKQVATNSLSEMSSENVAETETETETEVSSKELTTRATQIESLFENAWKSWPKKAAKKPALEKFKKLAKTHDAEELAAHITRFGDAYRATTPPQFIPGLTPWLNQERWTDDLPQPRTSDTAHQRAYERQAENLSVIEHFRQIDQHQQKGITA